MSNFKKALIIAFIIIFVDQIVKIWVKTQMFLGESVHVFGNWFLIQFTENNGMAFGWEFGGEFGKMFLSIFRIAAVFGICYIMWDLSKKNAPKGLLISLGLILAGAVGNIIDSAFYGIIFSESGFTHGTEAAIFPTGGGYGTLLHGKVVDMLYFPIVKGTFPSWFPFWGGERFEFFRPIFNIADSAITIGVFIIIIFQRKFFKKHKETNLENSTQTQINTAHQTQASTL